MIFHVAHAAFRVRITDESLQDDQGKEAAELIDWPNHIVWISSKMPVQRRLHALFHGLRHAWQMTLGIAADAESDADQSASYAIASWRELERQGGEAALMRLQSDGVIDQGAHLEHPAEIRQPQCGVCGGFLEVPIRVGQPRFDSPNARMAVDCEGDCEFCGHTVTWREAATTKGVRTGHVIAEQRVKAAHHVPSA
jgi:hypothetical protein